MKPSSPSGAWILLAVLVLTTFSVAPATSAAAAREPPRVLVLTNPSGAGAEAGSLLAELMAGSGYSGVRVA